MGKLNAAADQKIREICRRNLNEKTPLMIILSDIQNEYGYIPLEVIGCCLGTACYVKGGQQVIDKFSELLHIKPGETTEDGLFTLDALRCIGACGIAPAVTINGTVYPKMAVSQVQEVIAGYLNKENEKEGAPA